MEHELLEGVKGEQFNDLLLEEQVHQLDSVKGDIKIAMRSNIERKDKIKAIESNDRRIVHFLFNTTLVPKISPFARKFIKLLDGSLEEFEKEE